KPEDATADSRADRAAEVERAEAQVQQLAERDAQGNRNDQGRPHLPTAKRPPVGRSPGLAPFLTRQLRQFGNAALTPLHAPVVLSAARQPWIAGNGVPAGAGRGRYCAALAGRRASNTARATATAPGVSECTQTDWARTATSLPASVRTLPSPSARSTRCAASA